MYVLIYMYENRNSCACMSICILIYEAGMYNIVTYECICIPHPPKGTNNIPEKFTTSFLQQQKTCCIMEGYEMVSGWAMVDFHREHETRVSKSS